MRPQITIIALGAGNRRSIGRAIERAGGDPVFTDESDAVAAAAALVIPGVANVGYLIDALDRCSLRDPVLFAVAQGKPCLGICAGFQILFEGTDEAPKARGLGLLTGVVRRLAGPKSLHMGWNRVKPIGATFSNWAYFAHSYAAPADVPAATALTDFGAAFTSIGGRDHIVGVQFHPERSGPYGFNFLKRFVGLVKDAHGR
jgi:imidazole glycerol-phosphate synthase subunit HisH